MLNIKYVNNNELREMLKNKEIRNCTIIYFQDKDEEKIEFWKLKIAPSQSVIVPAGGINDEIKEFLPEFIKDNEYNKIIVSSNDTKLFKLIDIYVKQIEMMNVNF